MFMKFAYEGQLSEAEYFGKKVLNNDIYDTEAYIELPEQEISFEIQEQRIDFELTR